MVAGAGTGLGSGNRRRLVVGSRVSIIKAHEPHKGTAINHQTKSTHGTMAWLVSIAYYDLACAKGKVIPVHDCAAARERTTTCKIGGT